MAALGEILKNQLCVGPLQAPFLLYVNCASGDPRAIFLVTVTGVAEHPLVIVAERTMAAG